MIYRSFVACVRLSLHNAGYRRCRGGCQQWRPFAHFSPKGVRCQICSYQHSKASYRQRKARILARTNQTIRADQTISKHLYEQQHINPFAC